MYNMYLPNCILVLLSVLKNVNKSVNDKSIGKNIDMLCT